MDILFNRAHKQGKAEVGQVRYSDKNKMYVLITYSRECSELYDAIVLSECDNVRKFDWNTMDANSDVIERVYPYIVDATLEINN